ncbi:MAG: glycoside hydrolase family 3 protein [Treponema sp.]|nr:glycoside hydrolase family 3 protein [Treponema sp.]
MSNYRSVLKWTIPKRRRALLIAAPLLAGMLAILSPLGFSDFNYVVPGPAAPDRVIPDRQTVPDEAPDTQEPGPKEQAAALLARMSNEEALAQTFMLGWVGAEPSPLIINWIQDRHIGGVKIFGWNTEDTQKLAKTVGELQLASLEGKYGLPLLVATDQEGGWIRHVKGATSETPGNMAIGASGYPQDAYLAGYYIGKELAALGINMNFAPTVDLFTNRFSSLIGPRAFGSNPTQAGILGAAFMKGQMAAGIIPTAKHYPGHGDTDLDSHGVLPRIDAPFEVLWERELVPYRILIREGLPAVMSGHLAFPQTQAASTPASLSSYFLKEILRDTIGYQGLIITDDLMMNGATTHAGSISRAAKQALLAGNDIILLSTTPNLSDPVWTALVRAMQDEDEFRERVWDAARRVLEVKFSRLRGEVPYIPDLEKLNGELTNPEGAAFFLDLAVRSVTLLRGGPLKAEESGRLLIAGSYDDFFRAGKAAYPEAETYRWSSGRQVQNFVRLAQNADTIIFCLSDTESLNFLQGIQDLNKHVIVISVLNPVYLERVPWVNGAIAVYSYAPESFTAAFSVLAGRIGADGKLPYD